MNRLFPHALTVSVHLMLCALLACVAVWSQSLPMEADRVGSQTQTHLTPHAVSLQTDASGGALYDTTTPVPASALGATTTDLAGDLPELLLVTPPLMAETIVFVRQARQPMHALPHPFLERPQRPPRPTSVLA